MKHYYFRSDDSSIVYGVRIKGGQHNITCQIFSFDCDNDTIIRQLNFQELLAVIFKTRGEIGLTDKRFASIDYLNELMYKNNSSGYTEYTPLNFPDIQILDFVNSNTDVHMLKRAPFEVVSMCYSVVHLMFRDNESLDDKFAAIARIIPDNITELARTSANEYCSERGLDENGIEWEAFFTLVACQYICGSSITLEY